MKYLYYYKTKIGDIGIAENGRAITNIFFGSETDAEDCAVYETPLINKAAEQLYEYINGLRRIFDLPVEPEGTEFQRKVWKALETIPYGETRSYKQIAEQIGKPEACRAVGMANNRNPISIVIPCHRVIGSDGSLVGYGGGLALKEKLLKIEKEYSGI